MLQFVISMNKARCFCGWKGCSKVGNWLRNLNKNKSGSTVSPLDLHVNTREVLFFSQTHSGCHALTI